MQCLTPPVRKICRNIAKDCTTPKSCPPGKGCRLHSHISTVPDDDPDFSLSRPWLDSKIVENLQIQSNPDTRMIKGCYDELLNTEDLYKQDFGYLAMDQLVLKRRRQEILHKSWSENVYDPIRCAVEKEMSSCKFLEMQERKKQLYKDYLEYVNRKGHVFREVFDPAEYFPFSLTPSLQARTDPLNDPLLFQERERNREDAVAFRFATGCSVRCKDAGKIRLPVLPFVPPGRHGASWKRWNDMHLGQIDSEVRALCRANAAPANKRFKKKGYKQFAC